MFYGRSKVENGRTKSIVFGQIVHTLFISDFILCSSACASHHLPLEYSLMSKFAIKILCPLGIVLPVQWMSMGCPLDIPPSDQACPTVCPVHCTMGQVAWDCPWESTVPSEDPHITLLSYPTVPWDTWDCPWESTVPHEDPHITLSVLSHCTMGQVGLSMGVHCPT